MSERAGETCIKAERDPRRLHLGNNYMSANGQTDKAHFPGPNVGHVRSRPVPDLLEVYPRGEPRTPNSGSLCVELSLETHMKEKSHPCHQSWPLTGPELSTPHKVPSLSICPLSMRSLCTFHAMWVVVPW